jgi:membrane-associated HD superfamily phosphohydrolase
MTEHSQPRTLDSSDNEEQPKQQKKKSQSTAQVVRSTLLADTMKQKIRQMLMQIQELNARQNPTENEDEDKISETDDRVVECKNDDGIVSYDPETQRVSLTSPTFKDQVKIRLPQAQRFGSSKTAMQDLKHVEAQIQELHTLPDFGYGKDNYILNDCETNKWKVFALLLEDHKRFSWLMNFINLAKLESTVSNLKDREEMMRALKEKLRQERRVKFLEDEEERKR